MHSHNENSDDIKEVDTMNLLIMGKTPEICESISQLLPLEELDSVTTYTSGAVARGIEISVFDGIIVSTPLSD